MLHEQGFLMPHEQGFLTASLMLLLVLGSLLVIFALLRWAVFRAPAELQIGKLKLTVRGPLWLVAVVVGVAMISVPVLAAVAMGPTNITPPTAPGALLAVRRIDDPSYKSFRFERDISTLDLRSVGSAPWYAALPWGLQLHTRARLRPGLLQNTMIVRKVAPEDSIHVVYATSGEMDVRCTTHGARYRRAAGEGGTDGILTMEVIADVSAIPVGSEFELGVEATYWNAFAGARGDDYTTYSHAQVDSEVVSVTILAPAGRPFRSVNVSEMDGDQQVGHAVDSPQRTWGVPW